MKGKSKQTLAAFCQHLAASSFLGPAAKEGRAGAVSLPLPPLADNNVDTQRRMHALFALNRARVSLSHPLPLSLSLCIVVVSFAYCCSWKVGYVVSVITLPGPSPVQIKLKVLSACADNATLSGRSTPKMPPPPPSLTPLTALGRTML